MNVVSLTNFDFSLDEIERRKQLVRDLWAGRPVDHIPVQLIVSNPQPPYPMREQMQNADKQLQVALRIAGLSWQSVPEGDYIPAMRPDVGCSCLATAFGAELFWGDSPDQTCGVKKPALKDVNEAWNLDVPVPDAGQLAEGIRRVRTFAQAGDGFVSVSLLDMAGGLNVAMDLLGGEALYVSMREKPEALECLLDKIQRVFEATIGLQIEAAGGEDRITTTDFPDYWFPEGQKDHVSDDISANISPEMYRRFSLPCHDRIFSRYGNGGLHNCGPNPCLEQYLEHTPAPRALDLSYPYSRQDLPRIKSLYRKRALVYLDELPSLPEEAIRAFREIMELMTPDVAVVPVVRLTTDDDAAAIYRELREISEEYAKRMDWGWEAT